MVVFRDGTALRSFPPQPRLKYFISIAPPCHSLRALTSGMERCHHLPSPSWSLADKKARKAYQHVRTAHRMARSKLRPPSSLSSGESSHLLGQMRFPFSKSTMQDCPGDAALLTPTKRCIGLYRPGRHNIWPDVGGVDDTRTNMNSARYRNHVPPACTMPYLRISLIEV